MGDAIIPGGYVILARRALDSDTWNQIGPIGRSMIANAILQAKWSTRKLLRPSGSPMPVPRGSFATTWAELAARERISVRSARRLADGLKRAAFWRWVHMGHGRGSKLLFTIENFDFYNDPSNYEATAAACENPVGGAVFGQYSGSIRAVLPEKPVQLRLLGPSEEGEEGKEDPIRGNEAPTPPPDGRRPHRKARVAPTPDEKAVLDHYRTIHGVPDRGDTPDRVRRVRARFAEGFDVEKLKRAIEGAKRDPWIMGTKPNSPRPYNDIPTILRDAAQVDRLAALAGPVKPAGPPPRPCGRCQKPIGSLVAGQPPDICAMCYVVQRSDTAASGAR